MVRIHRSAKAVVVTMLLATSSSAGGQPSDDVPKEDPTSQPEADAREQALDLFETSKQHYRRGEFDQAASLLRRAHALYPEPVLLYNLARALESNGEAEPAVEAYDDYLKVAAPDAEERASAVQRVAALRRRLTERRRLEQRERQLERERREVAEALRREREARAARGEAEQGVLGGPLPWVLTGVGAAGLVAGGGLLAGAHAAHDAAVDEPSQREAANIQDRADRFQLASTVSFAAGGVIAATGISLLLVHHLGTDGQTATMRLWVAPSKLRVQLRF